MRGCKFGATLARGELTAARTTVVRFHADLRFRVAELTGVAAERGARGARPEADADDDRAGRRRHHVGARRGTGDVRRRVADDDDVRAGVGEDRPRVGGLPRGVRDPGARNQSAQIGGGRVFGIRTLRRGNRVARARRHGARQVAIVGKRPSTER
jgi:hypothetical protein